MAKRLQVTLTEPEYRAIRRAARPRHMSIAEWVRQALDLARRHEAESGTCNKLRIIRAATRFGFPTVDIDGMLAKVEAGYSSGNVQ